MANLNAIQMKIKRLQEQAEAIAAKQASTTLDRIQDLMQKHGIQIADIEAHVGRKRRGAVRSLATAARAGISAAKYRDPKSGATWSGRGRAPNWIANAKDRSRFVTDSSAVSSATAPASKGKAAGNYVRGPQPPKYRDPKSGATWSGRGPAPAWLASAKDRTRFLIAGAGDPATPTTAAAVTKLGAKKKPAAQKATVATKKAKQVAAKKVAANQAFASKNVANKKVVSKRSPVATKKAASKKTAAKQAETAAAAA
jgi:DNA-binding protein H-NS